MNKILVQLERLRHEYKDFPSSTELRDTNVESLRQTHASYTTLLQNLRSTSQKLIENGRSLQLQYDTMKAELASKINAAESESNRLQREQNLILNAMELLGRMYIEHEIEKRKQLQLSQDYTAKSIEIDEDRVRLEENSARHATRVQSATHDTEVAIQATDLLIDSVKRQAAHLQRWTDDAKSQHTECGIRALDVAHHSAVVKFEAYNEIWQVASASLTDAKPEIDKLNQDILSASAARFPHKVDSARRLKKELEDAIPQFEKTRSESELELQHIESNLFPSINKEYAHYGAAPRDVPPRDRKSVV